MRMLEKQRKKRVTIQRQGQQKLSFFPLSFLFVFSTFATSNGGSSKETDTSVTRILKNLFISLYFILLELAPHCCWLYCYINLGFVYFSVL